MAYILIAIFIEDTSRTACFSLITMGVKIRGLLLVHWVFFGLCHECHQQTVTWPEYLAASAKAWSYD